MLILDLCSAVTSSFGYACAVWGDSKSSKISRVWQSSHSGAAVFCVSWACSGASCTWTDKWMLAVLPSLLCLCSPLAEMPQFRSSSRNHKETGEQVSDSWMFKAYACTLGWKQESTTSKIPVADKNKLPVRASFFQLTCTEWRGRLQKKITCLTVILFWSWRCNRIKS